MPNKPRPQDGAYDRRVFLLRSAGLAAGALAPWAAGPARAQLGAPEALRVLEERDTQFGRIAVVETGRKRYLAYGPGRHFVYQSVLHIDRPHELEAPYTRLMMLGAVYAQPYSRMAHIGVGAGNMAGYAVRTFPSAVVHAVDIDRDVVALGEKYFGLTPHPRLHLHIADGRRWLADTRERFDVVMLDAYDAESIPPPLREAAFFGLVASRLAPGGVAMQNVYMPIVDTQALLAAMRPAFAQIDVYKVGQSAVLAAYQGPQRDRGALAQRARELDAQLGPAHSFFELLQHRVRTL